MENENTTDKILEAMKKMVEQNIPVAPDVWLRGCYKLLVLISDERNKFFDLQQKVAQMRNVLLDDPKISFSKAKSMIEATPEFKEMRKQEFKVKDILELVRVAKQMSRSVNDELISSNFNG